MARMNDSDGVTITGDLTVEGATTLTGALNEQATSVTINSNAAAGTDEDPSLILKGGDGGSEIIRSDIKQDSSADLLYIQMGGGAAGTTRKSPTVVLGVPGETTASMDSTLRFEASSDAGVNRPASIVALGEERRLTVTASNSLVLSDGTGSRTSTAGAVTHAGVTTYDLQTSGAVTIDSSGGAISVGADADAQPVNIATGAAARVIQIGNAASASLALEAGVGALSATSDVSLDVNAPLVDLSTQATIIGMIDNSGTALAIKEGSVNYAIFATTNGSEKIQLVQNVELPQISEVVAGAGIALGSGSEIIGVSKVVSTAIAYNTADGNVFQVPASEVWLIEDMWFQTAVDWDGNGAFIVGDATDADGFLTLANASLDPAYDESGGIAGWPTGSRGLDSANRGVYLTTAVTFNKRMFRAVGPYNVVLDNTPGTSTVGSGTLYMRYTRLA